MKLKHIAIVLACCTLGSCASLLEENLKSNFQEEGFYSNKSTLEAGLYGVYHGYRSLPLMMALTYHAGTDLAYPQSAASDMGILCTYTFTSEHGYFQSLWSSFYIIILRSNSILEACEQADYLTQAEYRRIKSEALFLRAQAYYLLVASWGDVPLITKTMGGKFDYTLPRHPLKDVYAQIIEDLTWASTPGYLPVSSPNEPARVNHYAAVGLLGKTYLTMASFKESAIIPGYTDIEESVQWLYTEARKHFLDVIENSPFELVPVYGDNFIHTAKATNTEAMFEVWYGPGEMGSGWTRDSFGGYISVSGTGNPSADFRLDGAYCGKRNLRPIGTFANKYTIEDSRFDWNIQRYGHTYNNGVLSSPLLTNLQQGFIPKFRQGGLIEILPHAYSECETNFPVMRFADVLLMFAETEIKLNGGVATQDAVTAVNLIIQRARYPGQTAADTPNFPNYTITTLTFDALMDERAKELCYESSIRKIDLMRTGRLESALAAATTYTAGYVNFDPARHYLFPIPAYEIGLTKNPEGFKQNPGYGSSRD